MKKGKRRIQEFKMPDGTITTSINKHLKAWVKVAEPFERATGLKAIGYDPQVSFECGITIPPSVLIKLNKHLP